MAKQIIDLNSSPTSKWYVKLDPANQLEGTKMPYSREPSVAGFEEIEVPAHWQTQGYDYQGIVWYYHRFRFEMRLAPWEKALLHFAGVDYQCEVWLNGVYLGAHEGDFDPFRFEVSEILREENDLLVKVESRIDERPEFKRILKGAVYHWDCVPVKQQGLPDCPEVPSSANPQYPNPLINPGGIWQPVYLEINGGYELEKIRITPSLVGEKGALLHIQADIYSWREKPERLALHAELRPANFAGRSFACRFSVPIRPGQSSFLKTMELRQPVLWWTWDLGRPNLYRLTLRFLNESGEEVLAESTLVGIREVKKGNQWELYLNGKRFFARGTNYLSDQFLSQATPERYDKDLEMMLAANMNMVRVFAHMENDYFYSQCDQKGLLVWQDLPFQWGYEPSAELVQRAASLAQRFVEKLYNHPSIFLWCCHSESRLHDYNKLDSVLETVVGKTDPTRPVWRNSVLASAGRPPYSFPDLESFGDYVRQNLSVHWVGWYWGKVEDTERYNPHFVTEFGTQSVPNRSSLARFMNEKDLWPARWEEWRRRGFQLNIYEKNLGKVPDTLEDLIAISQEYQCHFYKRHIEALRRKKYNNVNGLLLFHFVSSWPAIDWSIIDYYRVPKKAYFAVKEAFNPVLLTFTGDFHRQGVRLSVWIVNDLHEELNDLALQWEVVLGGKCVLQEHVSIPRVAPDCSQVYWTAPLDVVADEVMVNGTLIQGDKVISSNSDTLRPYTEDDIETPEKAAVGL